MASQSNVPPTRVGDGVSSATDESPFVAPIRDAPSRSEPALPTLRYRADVDGLRAVAILAVLLYHAELGCSGGYVGVDVFFVISGFLITSLIWKDLENGCFTFAGFWERRARRIVPALVAVTIATLAVGWFVLLPSDYADLGKAAASQAVFAANFYYGWSTNYFAGAADEKALLHTWSLAVEEQFYLIVPLLLWGMYRVGPLRSRGAVLSAVVVGLTASFALSVFGVMHSWTGTFYLLPTRAWELALGSLVALLPAGARSPRRRLAREILATTGFALIIVPVFLYSAATPFPGLAALPPCLGTGLLIWVNQRDEVGAPSAAFSLLSCRPVVFVGLISYSLYLWHWPLFAFGRYLALEPLGAVARGVFLCLGFLFGVLSWRYVETPFRKRTVAASRLAVVAYATCGLAFVLIWGLASFAFEGFPIRLSPQAQDYARAASDKAFIESLGVDDVRADRLVRIGVEDSTARPALLVWGDSHAMAALPAIDALLKERGLAGRAATHSSTAPVLDWYKVLPYGLGADGVAYGDAILSYVRTHEIRDVLLIASWKGYMDARGSDAGDATRLDTALLATVRRLVAAGARPWVLLSVPGHSFNVPRALSRAVHSREDIDSVRTKPTRWNEFGKKWPELSSEIEASGGRVLDPKPRFLDPATGSYLVEMDGTVLYRDGHHLTTRGSKLVLLPFLRDSLVLADER